MGVPSATESWLSNLQSELQPVAAMVRDIIVEACPDLSESIKWGNPVFDKNGKVCYLAATKSYVSLGFFNGVALSDPQGKIQGTGKRMRHIKLRSLSEIGRQQISEWVREAAALNQRDGGRS